MPKSRTIRTHTGAYIDVFDPHPDTISIQDIAEGLANVTRFSGQAGFYSVAQHSIEVMKLVEFDSPKDALAALLHDAAEAYVQDLASPIKHNLPEYVLMEQNLMVHILAKFGVNYPLNPLIKQMDNVQFEYEYRELYFNKGKRIYRMYPLEAKEEFLKHYFRLTNDVRKAQTLSETTD